MDRREDVIAYAREVYAACATVGFENPAVRALKALLDSNAPTDADLDAMLDAARRAQGEAISWVSR